MTTLPDHIWVFALHFELCLHHTLTVLADVSCTCDQNAYCCSYTVNLQSTSTGPLSA